MGFRHERAKKFGCHTLKRESNARQHGHELESVVRSARGVARQLGWHHEQSERASSVEHEHAGINLANGDGYRRLGAGFEATLAAALGFQEKAQRKSCCADFTEVKRTSQSRDGRDSNLSQQINQSAHTDGEKADDDPVQQAEAGLRGMVCGKNRRLHILATLATDFEC